jgi:hypothetical protein
VARRFWKRHYGYSHMVRSLCFWSAKWRKSKLIVPAVKSFVSEHLAYFILLSVILNLFISCIAETDCYVIYPDRYEQGMGYGFQLCELGACLSPRNTRGNVGSICTWHTSIEKM